MSDQTTVPAEFYTGMVAQLYGALKTEAFDPAPYARFVARFGQPALELGCGDGEPLLDLRVRGLDVEGLDSSLDMLDRCRAAARARDLEVVLHHGTFEAMNLGRQYRSMYFAGATFNLLVDDESAQRALERIAAHLEPNGAVLIPLFVPQLAAESAVGFMREQAGTNGATLRFSVLSVDRDETARTQTTLLHSRSGSGGRPDIFRLTLALVVLWSYHVPMSSVVKRSVSLPAELFERLESEAAKEGRTVSATLAEAADLWLSTRKGLKAVRAWERANGALTADELADADATLDRAGVGRR